MSLITTLARGRAAAFILATLLAPVSFSVVAAGGMSIQGTRIVYPQGAKQVSVVLNNSSDKDAFLIQSWVEDSQGEKSRDFVVTPPLFLSSPKEGSTLRLVYTGRELPKDRETLYYFVSKSVPSVDKKSLEGKNVLLLATASRIKLFVRPEGLKPGVAESAGSLTFSRDGKGLRVSNPSPYHITMIDIRAGSSKPENTMIAPFGQVTLPSGGDASQVLYRTINDYGGVTEEVTRPVR